MTHNASAHPHPVGIAICARSRDLARPTDSPSRGSRSFDPESALRVRRCSTRTRPGNEGNTKTRTFCILSPFDWRGDG